MKNRILVLLILVIILLLASCNDSLSEPRYGSLSVSVGNDGAKSVEPTAEEIEVSYYKIYGQHESLNVANIEQVFEAKTFTVDRIKTGNWEFYVEGFNSDNIVIGRSATQAISIYTDSTTNGVYQLELIDGQGIFSVTIETQVSRVDSIVVSLETDNSEAVIVELTKEDATPNDDGVYTFSKDFQIASGFYNGIIIMKDSDDKPVGIVLHPSVHIYANLTSSYLFTWEKLENLLPPTDVPVSSIEPGLYPIGTSVSLSTKEKGTAIWYSMGGDYAKYESPILLTEDVNISTYSTKENLKQSDSVEYYYRCKLKPPTVSQESGSFNIQLNPLSITLSTQDSVADIYYTLDGSDPFVSVTREKYEEDEVIHISNDTLLRAIAMKDNYISSDIVDREYSFIVSEPTSSLESGDYSGAQSIVLSSAENADIYYTIDGSLPTESSIHYSGTIEINESCTIKAICILKGFCSSVVSFHYEIELFSIADSGVISLASGVNLPSVLIIPNCIRGITVTEIGNNALKDCTNITSISIPDTVTKIGSSAFYGCTGLISIEIPSSVTSIGDSSFYGCIGLTSIEIPSSVDSIGDSAFYGCTGLTNIEIPSSVTSIGYYAFYDCTGLTSIEIPSSVTSIGGSAFSGCTGLTSIEIPSSVTSIGDYEFYGCTGLTSIEIPSSVTHIGAYAFSSCTGLTSIEIPSSVRHWGLRTFYKCTGLTSIKIPSSVTSIGNSAFEGCKGLTSIEIPSSVTSIEGSAFSGCTGLTSIEIPSSVTSIERSAFSGCTGLTSIEIPSLVKKIGDFVFYHCTGLTSIEIPSSVTSIGKATFSGCTGLTSIEIPSSVRRIGESAFYGCTGLTSIEIPSSVTSIEGSTFSGCTGLTSIEIPSSVTSIGNYAFLNCTGLMNIRFSGTIYQWRCVKKGDSWHLNCPVNVVNCSDGSALLDINNY